MKTILQMLLTADLRYLRVAPHASRRPVEASAQSPNKSREHAEQHGGISRFCRGRLLLFLPAGA